MYGRDALQPMAVGLVSMFFLVAGNAVHIGSRAVFCRLVCTRGSRLFSMLLVIHLTEWAVQCG